MVHLSWQKYHLHRKCLPGGYIGIEKKSSDDIAKCTIIYARKASNVVMLVIFNHPIIVLFIIKIRLYCNLSVR